MLGHNFAISPNPLHGDPVRRKLSFSLRSKGFEPHSGHPKWEKPTPKT